jgi:hypothetical protein
LAESCKGVALTTALSQASLSYIASVISNIGSAELLLLDEELLVELLCDVDVDELLLELLVSPLLELLDDVLVEGLLELVATPQPESMPTNMTSIKTSKLRYITIIY